MSVNTRIFSLVRKSRTLAPQRKFSSTKTRPFTVLEKQKAQCLSNRAQTLNNTIRFKSKSEELVSYAKGVTKETEVVADITEEEVMIIITEPDSRVISEIGKKNLVVLIFGWAGASHKNLSKYASPYLEAGYTTVQYVLPTRHIFRDTDQIPQVMAEMMMKIGEKGLLERPIYIHCLSDTGVMCYQGMDFASKNSNKKLNIKGVVWDSCPGPYPEITPSRVMALLIVNWVCCMRDKMGVMQSLNISYRLMLDRAWPNLLRKWQGKPVSLNLMDGTWCGHFGRDHHLERPSVPELFIYSNKDFYLPHNYLEQEVLALRKENGTNFTAVKFAGSAHVSHLKTYEKEYKNKVKTFIGVIDDVEKTEDCEKLHENAKLL